MELISRFLISFCSEVIGNWSSFIYRHGSIYDAFIQNWGLFPYAFYLNRTENISATYFRRKLIMLHTLNGKVYWKMSAVYDIFREGEWDWLTFLLLFRQPNKIRYLDECVCRRKRHMRSSSDFILNIRINYLKWLS